MPFSKSICKYNLHRQLTRSGGTGALSASTISAGVAWAAMRREVGVITHSLGPELVYLKLTPLNKALRCSINVLLDC